MGMARDPVVDAPPEKPGFGRRNRQSLSGLRPVATYWRAGPTVGAGEALSVPLQVLANGDEPARRARISVRPGPVSATGAVALVVAGSLGILVYAALWLLTPSINGPARISTERPPA